MRGGLDRVYAEFGRTDFLLRSSKALSLVRMHLILILPLSLALKGDNTDRGALRTRAPPLFPL